MDDNANDVGDYVGTQTDYSVDTLAPTTNTVEVSDVVVTDADTGAGKTLTVEVTYSEDMLTSVNPTIGFDPAVASSLTSTGGGLERRRNTNIPKYIVLQMAKLTMETLLLVKLKLL